MEKILAGMKAHIAMMQNELDDTKGLQKEMDEMKSRLLHIDELEGRCQSLEAGLADSREKCRCLEARCESLERSVQILAKDVKWKYSAPPIPAGHWIDRGFDENYVEGMEGFLRVIKAKTCSLRSGTCREHIYLGGISANNTILGHDDALLPHWEEFANAMQLYQNSEAPLRLYIFNMQLTSSVINLVTPALENKPISFFALSDNQFANAREGIDFAVEIIQSNQSLKKFYWANNPIESMGDATRLVETIVSHPLIDWVCLGNCFGENVGAYEVLCSLLASNKNFLHIDLGSNNIQTGGGTEISNFLATNPPLKHLSLRNNHLDDSVAVLIAGALGRNTNLRHLDLGRNDITDIGRNALRNVVFDSTSLNTVVASNHSCSIEGLDFGNAPINRYVDSFEVNRGRKIYSLLSSRNREGTNVHHLDAEFDDDSLRLVPKVLEAVHHNAGYGLGRVGHVHPLSIMYETLRSWKMPTLYENNGTA